MQMCKILCKKDKKQVKDLLTQTIQSKWDGIAAMLKNTTTNVNVKDSKKKTDNANYSTEMRWNLSNVEKYRKKCKYERYYAKRNKTAKKFDNAITSIQMRRNRNKRSSNKCKYKRYYTAK